MDLRQILSDFKNFLVSSYAALPAWMIEGEDENDSVSDWYQANWEILVEYRMQTLGMVDGYIDIYGDGADCNDSSSRVFSPNAQPSKSIRINEKFIFHSFGIMRNDFFESEPPFEFVKGESPNTEEEIILKFEEASFSIGAPYDDAL